MAKFDPIAAHPLLGAPYDKIKFARMNNQRVPLYRVEGATSGPFGASEALSTAFRLYGGKCFYCPRTFKPQALSAKKVHRDHVLAESRGGSSRLHNLVIACAECDAKKANRSIRDFRPEASDEYLQALNRHIARALGAPD